MSQDDVNALVVLNSRLMQSVLQLEGRIATLEKEKAALEQALTDRADESPR